MMNSALKEALATAIAADLGLDTPPVLQMDCIHNADRAVYRVNAYGQQQWYIVKMRGANAVKVEDSKADATAQEFAQLQQAWDIARRLPDGLQLSKPVAMFAEHQALLISGCDGVEGDALLRNGLLRWNLNPSPLLKACEMTGRWLGHFHAAQNSSADDWPKLREHRQIHWQRMLRRVQETQPELASTLNFNQLTEQFEQLMAGQLAPVGWVHGNYALRNLLIAEDSLAAIDVEDLRRDCLLADLGQILAELRYKQVLPGFGAGLARRSRQALLEGYTSAQKIDPPLLAAWTGYHLLVHLYEHATRRPSQSLKRLPQRLLLAYRMRQLASWLQTWAQDPVAELGIPTALASNAAMEA